MLRSIARSVGAVMAALLVAFALVVALEGLSAVLHPFPEGNFDMREDLLEHVAAYPAWVLGLVVLCWGGTTLLATWIATRLGSRRHRAHGWLVGLLLLLAVAFNQAMLPYPSWFELANYLVFPFAIVMGLRLARPPGWRAAETDSGV